MTPERRPNRGSDEENHSPGSEGGSRLDSDWRMTEDEKIEAEDDEEDAGVELEDDDEYEDEKDELVDVGVIEGELEDTWDMEDECKHPTKLL